MAGEIRVRSPKRPFRIGTALARGRQAVRPLPKAAMFALAELGHRSVFEQLVACILSIRTYDEVSLVAARRLFDAAPTAGHIARLPIARIDSLVGDVSFHGAKASRIRNIARTADGHGGELPCDESALLALPGVGPKCAHLALGIACGATLITVDIHVHRPASQVLHLPGARHVPPGERDQPLLTVRRGSLVTGRRARRE
jgi:endonuclease III